MKRSVDLVIGAQIATLRRRRGMTGVAVASSMRERGHSTFGQSAYSKIERGARSLWVSELPDLADVLGVPMAEILEPVTLPDPMSYQRIREMILTVG